MISHQNGKNQRSRQQDRVNQANNPPHLIAPASPANAFAQNRLPKGKQFDFLEPLDPALARCKSNPTNYYATYDLERHIGSGSFANVYHAVHQVSGKQVVLKVFDKDNRRAVDIEAARNEAQYLWRMHKSHHVIDIYDKLESTASIVLVLSRMDMSLKKYIEKRR